MITEVNYSYQIMTHCIAKNVWQVLTMFNW